MLSADRPNGPQVRAPSANVVDARARQVPLVRAIFLCQGKHVDFVLMRQTSYERQQRGDDAVLSGTVDTPRHHKGDLHRPSRPPTGIGSRGSSSLSASTALMG